MYSIFLFIISILQLLPVDLLILKSSISNLLASFRYNKYFKLRFIYRLNDFSAPINYDFTNNNSTEKQFSSVDILSKWQNSANISSSTVKILGGGSKVAKFRIQNTLSYNFTPMIDSNVNTSKMNYAKKNYTKISQIPLNNKMKPLIKLPDELCRAMMRDIRTKPENSFQILSYDYLAETSLKGIEANSKFRFNKDDAYLIKWWDKAKKWDLFGKKLLEIKKEFNIKFNKNESSAELSNSEEKSFILTKLKESCEFHRARVICIGDVHGCILEVIDLLRAVDFHPGDLVLFLGDLVSKGPKSVDVVKLAIDIGAIAVRGNHDHEVVRECVAHFSQKKMSISPNNNSSLNRRKSDHLNIALRLTFKEIEWLSQLPYYIKSIDLGILFVHAGFESSKRLSEQEPWVMMTLRSAYPNGKISHRCVLNYPWAKNWNGPLTVLFGHDAARGFQEYKNALGIDTGCVYGGNLSAILLPDKQIISVPARNTYCNKSRNHKFFASQLMQVASKLEKSALIDSKNSETPLGGDMDLVSEEDDFLEISSSDLNGGND